MQWKHPGARHLLVMWLLIQALPSRAAPPPCPDERGNIYVIEPGRERDIAKLIVPMRLGEQMPPPHADWTLRNAAINGDSITLDVDRAGVTHRLVLRPKRCRPEARDSTLSFISAEPLSESERAGPIGALWAAIKRHDVSPFYRTEAKAPPLAGDQEVSTAAAAAVASPDAPSEQPETGWFESLAALGFLIALAMIALVLDSFGMLRSVGLTGGNAGRVWAALLGLMGAGLGLRLAAGPTFIREAYPLPDVHFLIEQIVWSHATSAYPETPNLLAAAIASLVPEANPYTAWFGVNILFGVLTIFASYLLGASFSRTQPVVLGLVVATLVTFWPQHIRLSASESTHVVMVLFSTLSLAWAASAAMRPGWPPFLAFMALSALTATTRPEAALVAPALTVLALCHGEHIRQRLRSPMSWLIGLGVVALIWPTLMTIIADSSVDRFNPEEGTAEALGLHSLSRLFWTLGVPSVDNAFFDPATAPLWLYPLGWWGALAGWRQGHRAGVVASGVLVLTYLVLYTGLPPSVTLWGMSRYHLSAFPGMALLSGFGLVALLSLLPSLAKAQWKTIPVSLLVAMLGCGLYWPAMSATQMDWQQELHWTVELGESRPLADKSTRLVVPDNRRRFRDLNPRSVISALSRGELSYDHAATVEQAIEQLDPEQTKALYFEGLYCHLALGPGEVFNPQCEAMHRNFNLEPIAKLRIHAPCFLTVYAPIRTTEPIDLGLYAITSRRGPADGDRSGLPAPWARGQQPPAGWETMGSETDTFMTPSAPPLTPRKGGL